MIASLASLTCGAGRGVMTRQPGIPREATKSTDEVRAQWCAVGSRERKILIRVRRANASRSLVLRRCLRSVSVSRCRVLSSARRSPS